MIKKTTTSPVYHFNWRLIGVNLAIILILAAVAGGWGFGTLTGWHPAVTGLLVFVLYVWIYLYGSENYITSLGSEMIGVVLVTIYEIVILIIAGAITAIIWLLSLIPQYFSGYVLPFGPTLFVVWLVLSVILWFLEKISPKPEDSYHYHYTIGFYDDH